MRPLARPYINSESASKHLTILGTVKSMAMRKEKTGTHWNCIRWVCHTFWHSAYSSESSEGSITCWLSFLLCQLWSTLHFTIQAVPQNASISTFSFWNQSLDNAALNQTGSPDARVTWYLQKVLDKFCPKKETPPQNELAGHASAWHREKFCYSNWDDTVCRIILFIKYRISDTTHNTKAN